MRYAAVPSYNDTIDNSREEKEFLVVCVDIGGVLCKHVTAAPSQINLILGSTKSELNHLF